MRPTGECSSWFERPAPARHRLEARRAKQSEGDCMQVVPKDDATAECFPLVVYLRVDTWYIVDDDYSTDSLSKRAVNPLFLQKANDENGSFTTMMIDKEAVGSCLAPPTTYM